MRRAYNYDLPAISWLLSSIILRFAEPLKVCRDSTWYDPIVFILLNHVVHIFSVKGWLDETVDETVHDTTANLFLAFFMPYTGIWRCYVYFNAFSGPGARAGLALAEDGQIPEPNEIIDPDV